ncbi:hypothetical protein ACTFIU_005543 [Dictyostelium citrinum]
MFGYYFSKSYFLWCANLVSISFQCFQYGPYRIYNAINYPLNSGRYLIQITEDADSFGRSNNSFGSRVDNVISSVVAIPTQIRMCQINHGNRFSISTSIHYGVII